MNKDNEQREIGRVIKFRAIVPVNSDGPKSMHYFDLSKIDDCNRLSYADYDANALMQFTGLLDKNGKEIYEGDRLKFFDKEVATVVWQDFGGWSYQWTDPTYKTIRQQNPEPFFRNINLFEVIGNIYSSEPNSEMNDQRVKTDNEVIAEFMGFSSFETEQDRFWNPPHKGPARLEDWMYHTNQLDDFETSWDWLMPVVEKIENLGYYVNLQTMRSDKDGKYFCNITESNHSAIGHCFSNIKIESVYKAVIQFIHWYQKQKSS